MISIFRNPFVLPWLYPQLTWRIRTPSKELFLSFDDGPVPGPTDFVLQELAKFNAKATFFCIGDNIHKHPEMFRKIIDQQHSVGNHTFHHLSGWKTDTPKYLQDIGKCQDQMNLLQSARAAESGSWSGKSKLFRPPYGRITRHQIKSLPDYNIVMWDVLTHDYARKLSPDRCLKGSTAAARPGSIVVFHDSLKAEKNMMYVLPRFLDHFTQLGFTFKSLR